MAYFLFMDECYNPQTKISSLTGVLVPVDLYPELRASFYDILSWVIRPDEKTINMDPPELHGRIFLKDESDEKKLSVLNQVVDLIKTKQLTMIRVGYYINKETETFIKSDNKLISHCWFSIVSHLQDFLEHNIVIPVMDGFNTDSVNKFSGMIKSMDVTRSVNASYLSIKNSQNISEVFYANSYYSVFTQVADIVSYLRNIADKSRVGLDITEFQKKVLSISDRLEGPILIEAINSLTIGINN